SSIRADGRGVRGGGSWDGFGWNSFGPGAGGSIGNTTAYEGKRATVHKLLGEYYSRQPVEWVPGDENAAVPIEWLNQRLANRQTSWRVHVDADGGFEFEDIEVPPVAPAAHAPLLDNTVVPKAIALVIAQQVTPVDVVD